MYCSRDSIRASRSTTDIEALFDRVNHDVLMSKLANRIADRRRLGLIRALAAAARYFVASAVGMRRMAERTAA